MKAIAQGLIVLAALAALTLTQGREDAASGAQQGGLQARIDAAAPFDVVTVEGGVYHENIRIEKPIDLQGIGYPVIDAGGEGDVVTLTGPNVTISGFEIRGSGRAVSKENAAIKVTAAHEPTIRSNRIRDSLYGIHVTDTHHAAIAFNDIDLGANIPQARRGHGIYFWEAEHGALHSNTIRNAADGIHFEFSNDNGMGENTARQSRYGLHFMYSHDNRVRSNTFEDNLSGAVIMFSNNLLLRDNELSGNRDGATGAGILLKDVDNVFAEGNSLLRNKYGLIAEGSPNSAGATAVFLRNRFALNDTGVGLFTSAPITFLENAMIENTIQVQAISGALASSLGHGATAPDPSSGSGAGDHEHEASADSTGLAAGTVRPNAPVWSLDGRGNYWSDYQGYDADGDGVGDNPYEARSAFGGALEDNDTLRLFQFTLAQQAVDTAAEMFPVYDYDPVMTDTGPLMESPVGGLERESGVNAGLLVLSFLLLLLCLAVLQSVLDFDPLAGVRRAFAGVSLKGGNA